MDSINSKNKNTGKHPVSFKEYIDHINQLIKRGQNSDAIKYYNSLKNIAQKTSNNHLVFGNLALKLDLYTESETQFKAALKLSPENINILIALVRLYCERGYISLAISMIEKIFSLDPNNKFAHNQKIYFSDLLDKCRINYQDLTQDLHNTSINFPDIAYNSLIEQILNKYPTKFKPIPRRWAIGMFNLRNGGIQNKVVNIAKCLQSKKDEIEHLKIFCKFITHRMEDDFLLPRLKKHEIDFEEYVPIDPEQSPFTHSQVEDYVELLRSIHITGEEIAYLLLALINYRPEVFHGYGYQAAEFGIAAALAGVPRIILHSGNMRPGTMSTSERWQDHCRTMGQAYQALARLPNVIITNNCQAASSDYEQWLHLPDRSVRTIYNGVNFDAYCRPDKKKINKKRRSLGIPTASPVVGSAIRFVQQKMPLLWVETAAVVASSRPDAHFILLGDGPLLEYSKEAVNSLNLSDRFHFPGTVTDMDVWYGLMDIVLLTSIMEGTSNVAIEAQCQGIPVVSTNVGGMVETLVDGQSGWIVNTFSPALLAEKIIWIMDHPEWYAKAGKIGSNFVQKQFNMDKMIKNLLNLSLDT